MIERTPRLSFLAVAVAMVFTMVLSACTSGDDDASVTIYSGRKENLIGPILEEFTEATGIEVRVNYADSAELALLIDEEGDKSPADVFLSQSPGAIEFLEQAGRLAALPDSILDLVPSAVRDEQGRWVGFSGRQRVLVYNADLVDPADLPSSVLDLTGPEWTGQVGVAPSNGSFQDFVTGLRAQIGDDATSTWLSGMAANDAQTYPNNSGIVAAVGRGEVSVGLVNHYYNFQFLDEDPSHPGRNHWFAADDPGSLLIVTGAAILETSANEDNAQALVEFLLGESAQRFFADESYEYPLAAGVEPADVIPPTEFASVSGLQFSELGTQLESTREMIAGAGLDG